MKRVLIIAAASIVFLLSLVMTVYPVISNIYNERHKSEIHTAYEEKVEQADNSALVEAYERAVAYNKTITPGTADQNAYSQAALKAAAEDYPNQLDVTGTGIMGYVEIPILDLYLPIYHGTGADSLERGVGHLLGSSLPVGGDSTHAILTGHSGMATEKMFTDITQMKMGDVFYLHVLDQVLAYQVCEMNTVLPHDTSLLSVLSGRDLCTLVTCTPIGVNTHRLLVRGERIPYEVAEVIVEEIVPEEIPQSNWERQYLSGLLIGLGAVSFLVMVVAMIYYYRRFCHGQR